MALEPHRVFCAKAPAVDYATHPEVRFPELPKWAKATTALMTFRSLLVQAGLDREHLGRDEWNPLGGVISTGARVVIKPNWVHHHNKSGQGLDCLVTHTSVLEAILYYVARAYPASIVIGDAPVQGCDFDRLLAECRVPEMAARFAAHGVPVTVKDFRRTILRDESLGGRRQEHCRPREEYLLFDLATESLLEPITRPGSEFRVTMYHPDFLKHTHSPGKHQYLVARDVVEADVVINVPKLKTHKKAGLTGGLKNMVGINGHKEYLPHHRKGGSCTGGDCYPGRSLVKGLVEGLLDATNRSSGTMAGRILAQATRAGMFLGKMMGEDNNYDGSWSGNDTVWRMCLDLQRVLHYGRSDGALSGRIERTVLTVTDAIIAGEGDGPLSPTPVDFGMMTMGSNVAAVEWVHALLMGLVPGRLPLTREAFVSHHFPLTQFSPEAIDVQVDGRPVPVNELFSRYGRAFHLPHGWQAEFLIRRQGERTLTEVSA
jgi:uncharacterized protein (DUF362 family)